MGYLIIKESLQYHDHPIEDYLFDLGSKISFMAGSYLNLQLNEPLQFETDCPQNKHPGHYFDGTIPVFSKAFIDMLKQAGIDNFQTFPATLVNKKENLQWDDYFAFNSIGILDAANMEKSSGGTLMSGTDFEGMPELIDFDKLVIDPTKTKGAFMFRELRSPDLLIFDDKVEKYLKKYRPPEGWAITVIKLESVAS